MKDHAAIIAQAAADWSNGLPGRADSPLPVSCRRRREVKIAAADGRSTSRPTIAWRTGHEYHPGRGHPTCGLRQKPRWIGSGGTRVLVGNDWSSR
jgi:hypothetical protein